MINFRRSFEIEAGFFYRTAAGNQVCQTHAHIGLLWEFKSWIKLFRRASPTFSYGILPPPGGDTMPTIVQVMTGMAGILELLSKQLAWIELLGESEVHEYKWWDSETVRQWNWVFKSNLDVLLRSDDRFYKNRFTNSNEENYNRIQNLSTTARVAKILDRIKRNNLPPSPTKQWSEWSIWRREGAKTRHFGIIEMGGGVVQKFHIFWPRL